MTETRHPKGAPWRNFYGRLKGKHLRPSQQAYLDEDLAVATLPPPAWYSDDEVHARVVERVLARSWQWTGGESSDQEARRRPPPSAGRHPLPTCPRSTSSPRRVCTRHQGGDDHAA